MQRNQGKSVLINTQFCSTVLKLYFMRRHTVCSNTSVFYLAVRYLGVLADEHKGGGA